MAPLLLFGMVKEADLICIPETIPCVYRFDIRLMFKRFNDPYLLGSFQTALNIKLSCLKLFETTPIWIVDIWDNMNLLNFTETSGHESPLAIPPTSWWSHSEVRDLEETEIWSYFPTAKKTWLFSSFLHIFQVFIAVLSFRGVAGVKIVGMMSTGSGGFPLDATPSHHPLDHRIFMGFSMTSYWGSSPSISGKLHAKLGPCEMPQIDWNVNFR